MGVDPCELEGDLQEERADVTTKSNDEGVTTHF